MERFEIRTNQLPQLGNADSFSAPQPELTSALDGETLGLSIPGGGRMSVELTPGWARFCADAPGLPAEGAGPASVCRWGDGAYLIDIDTQAPRIDVMSIVLMPNTGSAIIVPQHYTGDDTAQFDRGPHAQQHFIPARISGAEQGRPAAQKTDELLGARDFILYSAEDIREYIYINHSRLVEHYVHTPRLCGKVERQHADYWKLDEGLYLIGWREMDTDEGCLAILDYGRKTVTGKRFYMKSPWEASSTLFAGALVPVSGREDYVGGLEPTN